MPELPDVEGYRRVLAAHLVGEVVRDVEVLDDSVIRNSNRRHFEATVRSRSLLRVDRRGKWLVAALGGPALVLHFGMTGSLLATPAGTCRSRFDRMVIVGRTEVRYRDVRKLGGVWLADDEAAVDGIIGPQGPDARAVSRAELARRLGERRGPIKSVLMDQRVIAGLGNMLSDEVLWRVGIEPARAATKLGDDEVALLHRSLRDVLRRSVRAGRIPRTRTWLSSQRQAECPVCPRCGGRLDRRSIGGRTALGLPELSTLRTAGRSHLRRMIAISGGCPATTAAPMRHRRGARRRRASWSMRRASRSRASGCSTYVKSPRHGRRSPVATQRSYPSAIVPPDRHPSDHHPSAVPLRRAVAEVPTNGVIVRLPPPEAERMARRIGVHLMPIRRGQVLGSLQQPGAEGDGLGVGCGGVAHVKVKVDLL